MSTPTYYFQLATTGYTINNVLNATDYVYILTNKIGTANIYLFQYDKSTKAFTSQSPIQIAIGEWIFTFCINSAEDKMWYGNFYGNTVTLLNLGTLAETSWGFDGYISSTALEHVVTDSTNLYITSSPANALLIQLCSTTENNTPTTVALMPSAQNYYEPFYDSINTCVWIGSSLYSPTSSSEITIFKYVPGGTTASIVKTITTSATISAVSSDGTHLWVGTSILTYQLLISDYSVVNTYTAESGSWRGIYTDGTGGTSDTSSGYTWVTNSTSSNGVLEIKQSTSTIDNEISVTASTITGDTDYIYFGNGQSVFYVYAKNEPICYNENTKILSLVNDEEVYVPIQDLRKGDLIKTYLHGYKKVNVIGKGSFINNVNIPVSCMYKLEKSEQNNLIEDLIVTGKHSILVDNIPTNTLNTHFDGNLDKVQKIDDKYLIQSSICKLFKKIEDSEKYTYYHLVLENDDDSETTRHGIWANGILAETTYLKDFKNSNLTLVE